MYSSALLERLEVIDDTREEDPRIGPLSDFHVDEVYFHIAIKDFEKAIADYQRVLASDYTLNVLLTDWVTETDQMSSIRSMKEHPNFARISRFGDKALIRVLQMLQVGSLKVQWFPMLKHLAGTDPVPSDQRGKVRQMADAWVAWGVETGKVQPGFALDQPVS